MLLFAMNPLPEAEEDFNAWYDQEHVPALAAVPGCLTARRFRIHNAVSEGNHRYLALYHLTAPDVCSSGGVEEGGGDAVDAPGTAAHARPAAHRSAALPTRGAVTLTWCARRRRRRRR